MVWNSIFYGGTVFGFVFISCEIGQQFTNLFQKSIDRLNRLNWYLFPKKLQRLLPIFMAGSQEPIVFECFGLMNESREQFKKVK